MLLIINKEKNIELNLPGSYLSDNCMCSHDKINCNKKKQIINGHVATCDRLELEICLILKWQVELMP